MVQIFVDEVGICGRLEDSCVLKKVGEGRKEGALNGVQCWG